MDDKNGFRNSRIVELTILVTASNDNFGHDGYLPPFIYVENDGQKAETEHKQEY